MNPLLKRENMKIKENFNQKWNLYREIVIIKKFHYKLEKKEKLDKLEIKKKKLKINLFVNFAFIFGVSSSICNNESKKTINKSHLLLCSLEKDTAYD